MKKQINVHLVRTQGRGGGWRVGFPLQTRNETPDNP